MPRVYGGDPALPIDWRSTPDSETDSGVLYNGKLRPLKVFHSSFRRVTMPHPSGGTSSTLASISGRGDHLVRARGHEQALPQ